MLSELNSFSGRILVLLHKIVEVIRTEPRCYKEYLRMDYEQRIREKTNEFIFRQTSSVSSFASACHYDIGQEHA